MSQQFCVIAPDVKLGRDVTIYNFVNLYGCEIGDGSRIGDQMFACTTKCQMITRVTKNKVARRARFMSRMPPRPNDLSRRV